MFCSKCGTSNPDNGNFCYSCGIALFKVKESSQPPATPTPTESKVIPPVAVNSTEASAPDYANEHKEKSTAADGFKNVEVIGSIGLLISFFLPWVNLGGLMSFKGYDIPNAVSALLTLGQAVTDIFQQNAQRVPPTDIWYINLIYVSPILSAITVVLAFLKKDTFWTGFSSGGAFLSLCLLGAAKSYPFNPNALNALSIGFYLSLISALLCMGCLARSSKEDLPSYLSEGSSKSTSVSKTGKRKAYWQE